MHLKRYASVIACLAAAIMTACAPAVAMAAPGFTGDLRLTLKGAYSGTNDVASPAAALDVSKTLRLNAGTGSAQADKMFADDRLLAASANEDLDLAGSLVDPLGVTLTFAKVKAIIVIADALNTNNVVVKPAATNGFTGPFGAATHTMTIQPGGMLVIAHPGTGWTVTAATGDLLNIANSTSGSAVNYRIIVIGTSA